MIDNGLFQRLTTRIDSYAEAMIEMQCRLTAIPALGPENGGGGELEKSRLILSCLQKFGFPPLREINAPDPRVLSGIRPNLLTLLPGKDEGQRVWILTHTDIVPPGELTLWSHDPYRCIVKDGKIFGRGVEDNQQDMVASIFAAKAFLDEGIVPEKSFGLAFVADEETSSLLGLDYLLNHADNPFRKSDLIVVPDSGNEEGSIIEVAEKSILWLQIKTAGKQCHASKPDLGKNAFLAASHLVVRLNDLHEQFGAVDQLYEPPASTFQPTKKEANVPNVNTIPGCDVFYLDCRVLPAYRLTEILSAIRVLADEIEQRFGVVIVITPVQQIQAPPPTPHEAPVVAALQQAIRDVYKVEAVPAGIGAGTVAAHFRQRGYPAAVWCRITQTAHQPDESCLIANMLGNAKVYAHLCLQY
jgi:succinyl-diaminopimelate desuccinylase